MILDEIKVPDKLAHFHVGWFQNTVPVDAGKLGPIALLRLDGDWYDSTKVCLEHLYPLLSRGGIVIMDDYWAWEGCLKATDEYREKTTSILYPYKIDGDAGFWIKG